MGRLNYFAKCVLQMIPVLVMVTVLVFLMIHLIPGDPARIMLGEQARQVDVDALRERMGLNDPLGVQYFNFIKKLVTLDFGTSLVYKRPVVELIGGRIGLTVALTVLSSFFAVILSIPLGYVAGMKKDRPVDQAIRVTALLAVSLPNFWFGLLLMILFGVILKWLPPGGWGASFWEQFRALILPAFTSCLSITALLARNLRNSVVDINTLDYVDFARSKGISEVRVSARHILRNGLISTITLLMMRTARMLGGSLVIETIFSLPGMGRLIVESIFARDYPVIQIVVFLFAAIVILMNLITDILYTFLDPRVHL